ADGIGRALDEQQARRDAEILAAMPHPLHTTAWWKRSATQDDAPADGGSGGSATVDGARKITVEAGTGRLKVVNAGFSAPFLPDSAHAIVVRDAAGKEVARSEPHLPGQSGT